MEGDRKIKPRRSHFKTRTGCVQCKKRKIKCDEQRPTCRKCESHGTPCIYVQKPSSHVRIGTNLTSTSSPQSPATSTSLLLSAQGLVQPTSFSILDLELIYSWSTKSGPVTFREKASASSTLHLTLVELALKHPFLMHEILSLSALHLAQTNTELSTQYNLASAAHHDLALSLFQPALASLNRLNSDACLAFSMILVIHTCAIQTASSAHNFFVSSKSTQSTHNIQIQWIKMHRGNHAVHAAVSPWLGEGVLAEFRPWEELLETSTPKPLPLLEQEHLDSISETWTLSSYPDSIKETLDEALKELRNVSSLTHTSQNSMKHVAALAWFSLVPEEFVKLVEARVPEAMLILASYAVVLKRMEHMWWCSGTAEALLAVARDTLGVDRGEERWTEYLRWPIEEVLGQQ